MVEQLIKEKEKFLIQNLGSIWGICGILEHHSSVISSSKKYDLFYTNHHLNK